MVFSRISVLMQNTVSGGAKRFHKSNHQKSSLLRSFLLGYDDGKTAQGFISFIAEAITEKVTVILASAHFMKVLTDGSQARKTGSHKEMVLVRTERNGNT